MFNFLMFFRELQFTHLLVFSFFCLVVVLLAETVLRLAGLRCDVELTVLYTSVFVGNSGTRLTVRNMGVGKHSSAEETRLLNPPELASPKTRHPFQANRNRSERTAGFASWLAP